ncbi:DUF1904 domain-containing protein [Shewanella subflava]|uniref:DUF1904 domain-containing protein n=1 Tax=Shewanella subflava TaxID=2986476 RepID=A0ABT3ICF7_9GAMM|nr:DUF1904 domain-containing protein [Shewanella subflava]MCW3173725.1 DUF1904 domain-containing protein [Shewanella subflava]
MPHITIRGVTPYIAETISNSLFEQLSIICGNTKSSYTLELLASKQFTGTTPFLKFVLVEIFWFPREKPIQDAVECAIRDTLTAVDDSLNDIAVMFHVLDRQRYYRNGKHF